ncbi:hypothetical protein [Pseudomonas aeruginosa]|uniref:hypothetical protein n=1 Tax=Pseudomonas aeruginosa TaxID=287 RepID=UPI002E2BF3DA|nr:hypothetical protein [Pseudomonas aeruginosa]HCL3396659.1 hypothetical protein [Pseudomonas aeruginosa]
MDERLTEIKNLGYEIDFARHSARDGNNGFYKLILKEDGDTVGFQPFRSNFEPKAKIQGRLDGSEPIKNESYMWYAVEYLRTMALAHTVANDRVSLDKVKPTIDGLSENQQRFFAEQLDYRGFSIEGYQHNANNLKTEIEKEVIQEKTKPRKPKP